MPEKHPPTRFNRAIAEPFELSPGIEPQTWNHAMIRSRNRSWFIVNEMCFYISLIFSGVLGGWVGVLTEEWKCPTSTSCFTDLNFHLLKRPVSWCRLKIDFWKLLMVKKLLRELNCLVGIPRSIHPHLGLFTHLSGRQPHTDGQSCQIFGKCEEEKRLESRSKDARVKLVNLENCS